MSHNDECRAARETALAMQTTPLTPAERAELRAHLASCHACRAAIGRLDDMIDAASTLDADEWGADASAAAGDDGWGAGAADDLFARIESAIDDGGTPTQQAPDEGGRVERVGEVIAFPTQTATSSDEQRASDAVVTAGLAPAANEDGVRKGNAPASRWWAGAALLLAAVLVGALVWSLRGDDTPEASVELAASNETELEGTAGERVAEGAAETVTETEAELAAATETEQPTVAPLSPSRDGAVAATDAVNVFASAAAQWSLSEGPEYELMLRSGAVLVEFVGDGSESLTLRTAEWSVQVVGTSFYADADGELDVRVHTGAVDVRVAGPDPDASYRNIQRVAAGEALVGDERRQLTADERAAFAGWIDPAAHADALEERHARASNGDRLAPTADPDNNNTDNPENNTVATAASPSERTPRAGTSAPASREQTTVAVPGASTSPSATADEVASGQPQPPAGGDDSADSAAAGETAARGEQEEPSGDEPAGQPMDAAALLASARAAQRAHEWAQAAEQYEVWLRQSGVTSQSGAVRLDIARIYLDRLRDPSRAMGHLETFVAQFPDDVAAPAARAELCRIAMSMGREVAACAP